MLIIYIYIFTYIYIDILTSYIISMIYTYITDQKISYLCLIISGEVSETVVKEICPLFLSLDELGVPRYSI